MGIDTHCAQIILTYKQLAPHFKKVVTIGRQELNLLPYQIKSLLNIQWPLFKIQDYFLKTPFCEPFFFYLGAEMIHSLDISSYEDCSYVIDLNNPIDSSFYEQYDFLYDGGSLEHIFHVPQALENEVNLVKKNGLIMIVVPGNNQFGHGFYQFSSELFFSFFNKERGFDPLLCALYENKPYSPFILCQNLKIVEQRTMLSNSFPTNLIFICRKTFTGVFKFQSIYQSDYLSTWKTGSKKIRGKQPDTLLNFIKLLLKRAYFIKYLAHRIIFYSHSLLTTIQSLFFPYKKSCFSVIEYKKLSKVQKTHNDDT